MKLATLLLLLLAGVSAQSAPARGAAPLRRRFALVVGANSGRPKVPLRHAVTDAHAFARVMRALGGVRAEDQVLLQEPSPVALMDALPTLRARMDAARAEAAGVELELVFYYSGHADSEGLLLHGGTLPYPELRRSLGGLGAGFRIAVLDSCASGAMTRSKGGAFTAPFLADASTRVVGEAIITSSSASEASQESDQLGGSFFTHQLLSGLRGAADVSRDGRVTLGEAYQFAFAETLARTERTLIGAQHPTYDMAVAGSGDVVLTDLRGASSVLGLPAELEGQLYLRDMHGQLVLELRKRPGQAVELGLDPGSYRVILAREQKRFEAQVELRAEGRADLLPGAWREVPAEALTSRGEMGPAEAPAIPSWRGTVGLSSSIGLSSLSLSGSLWLSPLADDGTSPYSLLPFLQRKGSVGVSLSSGAAVATLKVFPWDRTAVVAGVGLGGLFSGAQSTYVSAGVDHYFTPSTSASLIYHRNRVQSVPQVTSRSELDLSMSAGDYLRLSMFSLLGRRIGLGATLGVGRSTGASSSSDAGFSRYLSNNVQLEGEVSFFPMRELELSLAPRAFVYEYDGLAPLTRGLGITTSASYFFTRSVSLSASYTVESAFGTASAGGPQTWHRGSAALGLRL